jgi:beta-alanine degradation protein BauB
VDRPIRHRKPVVRNVVLVAAALVAVVACARGVTAALPELDPVQTDGDKYRPVFENALVRVLRYRDQPGAATHQHRHPCFVMYALGNFERELTFPDGSRRRRQFRAGEAAWLPAQTHTGHNTGDTPTDALLFELKGPCQ